MAELDQDMATFIHTLTHLTGVSVEYATKAWYSIRSPAGLAPEKQAKIYAGLYGLTKPKRRAQA